MLKPVSRTSFYLGSFIACAIMALSTGCASGGFKYTRKYAQFINGQMILIRIILYIFTSIVFVITMLVDMVIFNTIDFWQGKVSGGKYEFSKDGKTYQANHEFMPNSNLKRSTIEVYSSEKQLLQIVVLLETPAGEIEMSVDGVLRARVQDINSLPLVSAFDAKGQLVETKVLFNGEPMTSLAQAN